jgi:2-methylisocitrate lyase-like PEP mutase family enzyme
LTDLAQRRAAFRALHSSGCFTIPNPWDGGSAVRMAKAGFKAIASTSAGAAWARGRQDGELTVDEVLDHLRMLCSATDLPVNADFESGFAGDADGVGRNVARCIETGVAGLSVEDRNGSGLYPVAEAVDRLGAARRAIDRSGADVLLVGRCESYLVGLGDLEDVVDRLKAYAAAGADCLYAPGAPDLRAIGTIVRSVDRPVNANLTGTGLSVDEMASVGVRRVSVGGAMAKAAYAAIDELIETLRMEGRVPY